MEEVGVLKRGQEIETFRWQNKSRHLQLSRVKKLPHTLNFAALRYKRKAFTSIWIKIFSENKFVTKKYLRFKTPAGGTMTSEDLGQNILLYSTSAAAQVWAAVLVFQVLLARDQSARIASEIDNIWDNARYWWKGLIQNLRGNNGRDLGTRLESIGLDERTVMRAETDVESFKKILRATKAQRLIQNNNINTTAEMSTRVLSGDTFQETMDALAERLEQAEKKVPHPRLAFSIGVAGAGLNMAMLLTLRYGLSILGDSCLIGVVAAVNLLCLGTFAWQIKTELKL